MWITLNRGEDRYPLLIPERNAIKMTQVEMSLGTQLTFDGKTVAFKHPESKPKKRPAYVI